MFNKVKDGEFCPLVNGECVERKCKFWVRIVGHNPQGGALIDHYNCAVAWLPVLMIENSQMQRQTGAAVESFRNEMTKNNTDNHQILLAATNLGHGKLIEG